MASHGVLFDLDDTLYDELSFVHGAMAEVAKFLAPIVGGDADGVCGQLLIELARSGRGQVFDAVVAELGLPDRLVPTLVYVYRSARPPIKLFGDARPLLDRLSQQRISTGVLTDGNGMVQSAKVHLLGLHSLLDVVVFTDAIGRGAPKPDPLGFEIACDLFGMPPERVTYVANDLRKDYAGPRKLGMHSIHVARGQIGDSSGLEPWQRPNAVVERLVDVWPLIRMRMEASR